MTSDDDRVGYRRPPKAHQFQRGVSGNPKGRPRRAAGLKSLLKRELAQTVLVTEGGRTTKVSKLQVVVKRLVERASKGEPAAVTRLVDLVVDLFGVDGDAPRTTSVAAEDQAVLDEFVRRVRSNTATDADDAAGKADHEP